MSKCLPRFWMSVAIPQFQNRSRRLRKLSAKDGSKALFGLPIWSERSSEALVFLASCLFPPSHLLHQAKCLAALLGERAVIRTVLPCCRVFPAAISCAIDRFVFDVR